MNGMLFVLGILAVAYLVVWAVDVVAARCRRRGRPQVLHYDVARGWHVVRRGRGG